MLNLELYQKVFSRKINLTVTGHGGRAVSVAIFKSSHPALIQVQILLSVRIYELMRFALKIAVLMLCEYALQYAGMIVRE